MLKLRQSFAPDKPGKPDEPAFTLSRYMELIQGTMVRNRGQGKLPEHEPTDQARTETVAGLYNADGQ